MKTSSAHALTFARARAITIAAFAVSYSVVACDRAAVHASPDGSHAASLAASSMSSGHASIPHIALPSDADRKDAPGFDGANAWLNVDHPLAADALRGHVVLVDFWTSCCINCLQTLPILAKMEKTFAQDPFLVVGVHSPKFDAETERERLRAAVEQYGITHPVAIDGQMAIWNKWGVKSWPTLYVLDAAGKIVWMGSGEPNEANLASVIASAIDDGESKHALVHAPVQGLSPERAADTPLLFPTKAIALEGGATAIADSGHNRVVLLDKNGKVSDVIGSGLAGATDGGYGDASFHKPQGLAILGDHLYVADTENHLVRMIDRKARTVTTVAGTGSIGQGAISGDASPGRTTALRSPWDLAVDNGKVYIALAGSHQIGVLDPTDNTVRAFAGDGNERRLDGVGLAASFAQPSGLAVSPDHILYSADSETSSVRAIDLTNGTVRTVVGKDLFIFGDVDGDKSVVRFEHPIGIAYGDGHLWVADTYNSKIKQVDPVSGATKTIAGGRDHAAIFEPNGLFARAGKLIVVDTDDARLVTVDENEAKKTPPVPIAIAGLTPPTRGVAVVAANPNGPPIRADQKLSLPAVRLAQTGQSTVHLSWDAPKGTGVNQDAPFRVRWRSSEGLARAPDDVKTVGKTAQNGLDVGIDPLPAPEASLVGDIDLVVCDIETHRVCVPLRREITLTVELVTGGPHSATVAIPLPEAKP